jgi:hypothetical protein
MKILSFGPAVDANSKNRGGKEKGGVAEGGQNFLHFHLIKFIVSAVVLNCVLQGKNSPPGTLN